MSPGKAAPKNEEVDSATSGTDAVQTRTNASYSSQGRWLKLKTRRGRNEPILILGSICISAKLLPDFLPTNHLSSVQVSIMGQVRS